MNSSNRLWKKLLRPKYRDAFIAANVGVQIAAQLHALRTSRGKSQDKLADEIGMNQATISQMEKPEYRKYNIGSLIRFAQYYKVALDVRFVSITEHVRKIIDQTSESLAPPAFGEVSGFGTTDDPVNLLLEDPRGQKIIGRDQRAISDRSLSRLTYGII
jgi:transcriptional regulator with XRE-family HTH domain